MEDRPTVVLQGHLDMVPVAVPGKTHIYNHDPIDAYIDGDCVWARASHRSANTASAAPWRWGLLEGESIVHLPIEREAPANGQERLSVQIGGLRGGQSGIAIHLGSGNKLLGRCLDAAREAAAFNPVTIGGGNGKNAIADRGQSVAA